jgi:hypothetical protein
MTAAIVFDTFQFQHSVDSSTMLLPPLFYSILSIIKNFVSAGHRPAICSYLSVAALTLKAAGDLREMKKNIGFLLQTLTSWIDTKTGFSTEKQ